MNVRQTYEPLFSSRMELMTPALPVVVLAHGMDTLCDMRLKSAEDTALRIVASSETVSAGALYSAVSTELVVIFASVSSAPRPMQLASSRGTATTTENLTAAATGAFWA